MSKLSIYNFWEMPLPNTDYDERLGRWGLDRPSILDIKGPDNY